MAVERLRIAGEGGRQLDVFLGGAPQGTPVLVHHGTFGSGSLYAGWVGDAERRGIRLISYSRPGYGGSSRDAGRDVARASTDVAAIASHLGITRLATWGYSGGAPHALACASLLPKLVVAAATIACPAPYRAEGLDFVAGMGEDNVREFSRTLEGEAAIRPDHEAAVASMGGTAEEVVNQMASIFSQVDRAVVCGPLAEWLEGTSREAFSSGVDGWVDDDLAFVRPWGFDPETISLPLQLWQGGQDLMVPTDHYRWLSSRLPQADAHFLPDEGHMTLLVNRVPEVHAWLLDRF